MTLISLPSLPDPLKRLLRQLSDDFDQQNSTAWINHVKNDRFKGRYLLKQGQVDFDGENEEGLSPTELTLLYCYHLMPEHLAAALHVCKQRLAKQLRQCLKDNQRIVLIDIGAGPLTFGLALIFGSLAVDVASANTLDIHYIAVDNKAAMRLRAKSVVKTLGASLGLSTFQMINGAVAKADRLLKEVDGNATLLVSGSYVFAQKYLDSSQMVDAIGNLFMQHTTIHRRLVVLNPTHNGNPLSFDQWPDVRDQLTTNVSGGQLGEFRSVEAPRVGINWNKTYGRPIHFYSQVVRWPPAK